jgi:DNA uptake protein ComE-like DNA-binding protein
LLPFGIYLLSRQKLDDRIILIPFDSTNNEFKSNQSGLEIHYDTFDPNQIRQSDWENLGLSHNIAAQIERYKSKGGAFYKKTDLLKIYGIDSSFYLKIEPYIIIPAKKLNKSFPKTIAHYETYIKYQKAFIPIDLNTADSLTLLKLPGIGNKLSTRIIKYRNLLGGFYDTIQLHEVYGITTEEFQKIKNKIYTDTNAIIKIELNTVPEIILRKHPYIGKYKATLLVKYRTFQKKIISPTELLDNQIFTNEELQKLLPYLKF